MFSLSFAESYIKRTYNQQQSLESRAKENDPAKSNIQKVVSRSLSNLENKPEKEGIALDRYSQFLGNASKEDLNAFHLELSTNEKESIAAILQKYEELIAKK